MIEMILLPVLLQFCPEHEQRSQTMFTHLLGLHIQSEFGQRRRRGCKQLLCRQSSNRYLQRSDLFNHRFSKTGFFDPYYSKLIFNACMHSISDLKF